LGPEKSEIGRGAEDKVNAKKKNKKKTTSKAATNIA